MQGMDETTYEGGDPMQHLEAKRRREAEAASPPTTGWCLKCLEHQPCKTLHLCGVPTLVCKACGAPVELPGPTPKQAAMEGLLTTLATSGDGFEEWWGGSKRADLTGIVKAIAESAWDAGRKSVASPTDTEMRAARWIGRAVALLKRVRVGSDFGPRFTQQRQQLLDETDGGWLKPEKDWDEEVTS